MKQPVSRRAAALRTLCPFGRVSAAGERGGRGGAQKPGGRTFLECSGLWDAALQAAAYQLFIHGGTILVMSVGNKREVYKPIDIHMYRKYK